MSEEKEYDNPFQTIIDVYNEGVKEADEAGYADIFKKCTELFFESIKNDTYYFSDGINFEDVEYLDGYYIFGFGTNSVVHFHIKECPGWKFGIWWRIPDKNVPNNGKFRGDFFALFEANIDKFKPSTSIISETIVIDVNNVSNYNCWNAEAQILFIITEPYLAFCRDYNGYDYNTKYVSREEAKQEYDKYIADSEKETKYTKEFNDRILSFVEERILPEFVDSKIVDRGDSWSPRYIISVPLSSNKDIVDTEGWYRWDSACDDEEGQKLVQEYYSIKSKCESEAVENGVYWHCPISEDVYVS